MGIKPSQAKLFISNGEHYLTPPKIIDKVLEVFSTIDLDPCANEAMNIPALFSYNKKNDGLSKFWNRNVYVNPPYGRQIRKWTQKATMEFLNDSCTNIILLVPARVDTRWFQEMIVATLPLNRVCFWKGRLGFSIPNYTGKVSGAPFPSAIVLLSHNAEHFRKFEEVFGSCGLMAGF